jgi:hypothetical protein
VLGDLEVEQELGERRQFKARFGPEEISLINPNTGTLPIFRNRWDADLTAAIYRLMPVLWDETKRGGNPWGITVKHLFNMTDDSDLFCTRHGLEADGWRLHGNVFVRDGKRMLPVYESKMAYQFDHRWNSYYGTGDEDRRRLTLAEKQDPAVQAEPRYWIAEDGPIPRRRNGKDIKVLGVSEHLFPNVSARLPGPCCSPYLRAEFARLRLRQSAEDERRAHEGVYLEATPRPHP